MLQQILDIDKAIFHVLNSSVSNPVGDVLFPIITNQRTYILPILILLFFFFKKEGKKAIYIFFLCLVLVAITDPLCIKILKPFFGRFRPCHPAHAVEGVRNVMEARCTSYSFPSAHALNTFAQAVLFTAFYPRKWIYFMPFAFLIGYSRIYVGVHFPLDVLGGAFIGTLCGLAVFFPGHTLMKRKKWFLKQTPEN